MAKTAAKTQAAAKASKGKASAAPVEAERGPNRYLRAARIIVASGEGDTIDIMRLVAEARMSEPTARHCLEAWKGVCTALREAGKLPAGRATPKRLPAAPSGPENAEKRQALPA